MSPADEKPIPESPTLNDWGSAQTGNDMGLAAQPGPDDVPGAGVPRHGEPPFRAEDARPSDTEVLGAIADQVSGKNQPAPEEPVVQLDTRPMPEVGHPVVFYPRPGEGRAGRLKFPATVMARDTAKRTLDLLVHYDRDDVSHLQRMPERSDREPMGWEMISALPDRKTAFRIGEAMRIITEQSQSLTLLGQQTMALHERLQKLESGESRERLKKAAAPAFSAAAGAADPKPKPVKKKRKTRKKG